MNYYFIQGFRKFNFGDYSRNNLEYIHSNFNLTIIDIYNLIGKKKRNNYIVTNLNTKKLPKNLKILEFKSFYSFLFFLTGIEKKSLVICEGVHSEFLSIIAFIIIKIRKSYIVRHGYSAVNYHYLSKKEKFIDKITQILNNKFITNLKNLIKFILKILDDLIIKFFMIKADFYVYSGSLNYDLENKLLNKKTLKLGTYSHEVRECKKKHSFNFEFKYAVFIDQAIGVHPESLGLDKIQYDNYYNKLENFFLYLEKKYSINIIIAGHPLIQNHNFKNRRIFYNSTCELVKNSEFTIGVTSSSILYPFLFNKKSLLIVSNEILKLKSIEDGLQSINKLTGIPHFNIDDLNTMSPEISILKKGIRKRIIKELGLDPFNFYIKPYEYIENFLSKK